MTDLQIEVARALLDAKGVGFAPQAPVTFKSGIVSPVYVDNRRLPFVPAAWRVVIEAFRQVIAGDALRFDVVAGIEAGGIPHSAALGYALQMPSVFVRKQAKEHGQKKAIEGGEVAGLTVLLIEDLVTTGSSSLAAVEALRNEGALVNNCLTIVSYGFPQAKDGFAQAGVKLCALTNFGVIVSEAYSAGLFSEQELAVIEDWRANPLQWGEKYGFA